MELLNLIHILLILVFLATATKGDEDIVSVDSLTCDSSCDGCVALNYYYFESGGANTEDFYIIGEPSTLFAVG